ncbi:DUF3010 family protein [uncultured Treponema sp.]|uniref:DUF3010 family protein n=1 Tax=uncultured Treponema sp. TaxID=162155 RepID=UPI0025EF369B|nr:DUF3010 family protein [uncultured Treponema sp.]
MHIGIEVKKQEIIIVSSNAIKNDLIPGYSVKLSLDNDEISECIDFKKSLKMLFEEKQVSQISLIVGNSDSSKIRIIIEYLIQEVSYQLNILINTYSSTAIKKLKDKFAKENKVDFSDYCSRFNLKKYQENAFLVTWRYGK